MSSGEFQRPPNFVPGEEPRHQEARHPIAHVKEFDHPTILQIRQLIGKAAEATEGIDPEEIDSRLESNISLAHFGAGISFRRWASVIDGIYGDELMDLPLDQRTRRIMEIGSSPQDRWGTPELIREKLEPLYQEFLQISPNTPELGTAWKRFVETRRPLSDIQDMFPDGKIPSFPVVSQIDIPARSVVDSKDGINSNPARLINTEFMTRVVQNLGILKADQPIDALFSLNRLAMADHRYSEREREFLRNQRMIPAEMRVTNNSIWHKGEPVSIFDIPTSLPDVTAQVHFTDITLIADREKTLTELLKTGDTRPEVSFTVPTQYFLA